jgi:hypothetical protein
MVKPLVSAAGEPNAIRQEHPNTATVHKPLTFLGSL